MTTEDEIIINIDLSNFKENEKNDFFGFEASKKKVFIIQEQNRISDLEVKIKYADNRVFINHGDSYHGKHIINVNLVSAVKYKIYINNIPNNNKNEKFIKFIKYNLFKEFSINFNYLFYEIFKILFPI